MKHKLLIIVLSLATLMMQAKKPKTGTYRAVLLLDAANGLELPFNFDLGYKGKKPLVTIRNADERIVVDEIRQVKDSLIIKMPVFDTEFRLKVIGDTLVGHWINHYRKEKNKIPFKAVCGDNRRFTSEPGKPDPVFEGRWEVTFSPGTAAASKAIGVFHHSEQTDFVTGTFLTETGDYRYLEGQKIGNQLWLSCFDGSHAFLFKAEFKDGALVNGLFYSGAHWQEPWAAIRNPEFKLANPNDITLVKDPALPISFSFQDLEGKTVTLKDQRYANKPVIIQVMGSWCPNCMDESAYFAEVYKQYRASGLEIIALAFEKTTDQEKARKQVLRLKQRFDIDYAILLTLQTGKDKALEVLPMLNKITSFPTTLFLNKQHQVVKVHTGFSGPATGNDYLLFKQSTELLIQKLLKD